nr:mediator of RNA polymerase II transcription subunit 19 isoform X2 [Anolis sagrei ordinatus]
MGCYPHPECCQGGHVNHEMPMHTIDSRGHRQSSLQHRGVENHEMDVHPADVRGPSTSSITTARPHYVTHYIQDAQGHSASSSVGSAPSQHSMNIPAAGMAASRPSSTAPINDIHEDEPISARAQGDATPQGPDSVSQTEGVEHLPRHVDSSSEESDVPDYLCLGDNDNTSLVQSAEINKFNVFIGRMIKALDLPAPKASEHVDDPMFPSDEQVSLPTTILPVLPYLLKLARVVDTSPMLVPAIPRRLDVLYKIDVSSNKWVVIPPRPNTVVAEVAKTKRPKNTLTSPPDKEGKKIGYFGQKGTSISRPSYTHGTLCNLSKWLSKFFVGKNVALY